uniref:Inhibin alpha chain n=1 Tax=Xenopus laevis TaxID=8355 RepID=B7ZRR2_XENLA|nr:LOC100127301 protein [Xenopus laevis]
MPEGDRQLLLAKVKEQIIEALGSPPPLSNDSSPTLSANIQGPVQRMLHKRHSKSHQDKVEDVSQVILFPSSDVLCETTQTGTNEEGSENSFTYIFRPSPHIRTRRVSAAQLWFYTGPPVAEESSMLKNTSSGMSSQMDAEPLIQTLGPDHLPPTSGPAQKEHMESTTNFGGEREDEDILGHSVDLQVLSEHELVTVATTKVQHVNDWMVFRLAPAFLNYVTREIFVFLVHCPKCPCSDQPEYTPFIVYSTHPTQRNRRSGMPWSPSALELLQRPPESGAGNDHCHRGSLNISFEELGWDQWIVHPGSFQFHYCHGTCSPTHGLTPALHWGHCCAAIPSTMKSLRVTTTNDGGFSYRYETVPNLLTQDCACS